MSNLKKKDVYKRQALMIELAPQPSHIRKLQHELVEQYNLQSTSIGEEPDRHLRIEK